MVDVPLAARVLTVSDSVVVGERDDRSGPAAVAWLAAHGYRVDATACCADGVDAVGAALRELCSGFVGLVVSTGGTGFGPRDLTPEATRPLLDREAPGLAEAARRSSPLGGLSRGVAGTAGAALVMNLPGSPRGVTESLDAVADLLPHALRLLAGSHEH